MDKQELTKVALEIAHYLIENGTVKEGTGIFWLPDLGVAVENEADQRGYQNANEIAEEAVRLYRK
jgi:hypothetical protein